MAVSLNQRLICTCCPRCLSLLFFHQAVGNGRSVQEVRMHAHEYFVNLQMVTQVRCRCLLERQGGVSLAWLLLLQERHSHRNTFGGWWYLSARG